MAHCFPHGKKCTGIHSEVDQLEKLVMALVSIKLIWYWFPPLLVVFKIDEYGNLYHNTTDEFLGTQKADKRNPVVSVTYLCSQKHFCCIVSFCSKYVAVHCPLKATVALAWEKFGRALVESLVVTLLSGAHLGSTPFSPDALWGRERRKRREVGRRLSSWWSMRNFLPSLTAAGRP